MCGVACPSDCVFLVMSCHESVGPFPQTDSCEGCQDAEQDNNDVMVTRVDGCPPDADTDESDPPRHISVLPAHGCIDGGDEHVGCM